MGAFYFLVAAVVALNLYALALVLLRAPIFGGRLYTPMVLNLGLSISPAVALVVELVLLLFAIQTGSSAASWAVLVVCTPIWLLLLPNAAYLITELNFSHRRPHDPVPLWFDIVLVLTLALSGVMNTLMNLALAQTISVLVILPNNSDPLRHPASWVIAAVVLLLVAFGIYLGRYLRFNSWDLAHPSRFVSLFRGHFADRSKISEAIAFTFTHAALLSILYLLVIAPVIATLAR